MAWTSIVDSFLGRPSSPPEGKQSSQRSGQIEPIEQSRQESLVLPDHNRVIAIAGFAGAGKTLTITRIAQGLGSNTKDVAVIINEIGGASTEVDLDQISKDLAKLGIDGCACCASNQQMLEAIGAFHRSGKKLILIEQSGLSRTPEFASSMSSAGLRLHVLSLINPHQLDGFEPYIIRHIRGADSILLTHCSPSELESATGLIRDLREDLNDDAPPAISVDGNLSSPFPANLWEVLITRDHSAKLTSKDNPRAEQDRQKDLQAFHELEIVLWNGTTVPQIEQCVTSLATAQGRRVEVLRVKGVIDGQNLNITPQEKGRYQTTLTPRKSESTLFRGQNYILIRALDPALRMCISHIVKSIGIPDFSHESMKAIAKLYPPEGWLRDRFDQWMKGEPGESGLPPTSFAGDGVLVELREALSHIRDIRDPSHQQKVAFGIESLLTHFLQTRQLMFRMSDSQMMRARPDSARLYVDMCYSTLRVITDVWLGQNAKGAGLCQAVPAFRDQAQVILSFKPARMMVENLGRIDTPTLEGRTPPNVIDLEWLTKIVADGISRGELSHVEVFRATKHLEALPGHENGGRKMAEALRAGVPQ